MKRKKIQYKKLEALMPIARRLAKISNYKFICAVLCIIENDCKWMNMKFSRLSKNGITAKSIAFFLENPILEAIKKHKLFNKENSMLSINSTIIEANNEVTSIL